MDKTLTTRRRFSKEEKMKVLAKTACKCGRCGRKLEVWEATIDHIIPLNKGGLNDEFNLVALCFDCNEDKSNFMYNMFDYYKHILPEYIPQYYEYHGFAAYDMYQSSLFAYSANKYKIYPDKQKQLLVNMMRRGVKPKKIAETAERMGTSLYLTRAYTGDAEEIMELINYCINNNRVVIKNSLYKNDYMIVNDIKDGEVYVLRAHTDKKICGVFIFKKINDDTLQFPQIQSIIMNSALHAKYIMTGAFVNYFAAECFDDIMQDITGKMMKHKAIPIYFDILGQLFVDRDECISLPYRLDGTDGLLEFMPLKYIRKQMSEMAKLAAAETNEDLTEEKLELFTDALINHRNQSEFETADEATKKLFEEHETLMRMFKPTNCDLYGVGFNWDSKEEKDE